MKEHNLAGDGTIPNASPLYRCPDIIVRQSREVSPTTAFSDLTDDSLSENVEAYQDNWIYLRLQNRGSVTGDVDVKVYWAAPNMFAMPAHWHLIDTVSMANVEPGGLSIAEIRWPQSTLPPQGHFCLCVNDIRQNRVQLFFRSFKKSLGVMQNTQSK